MADPDWLKPGLLRFGNGWSITIDCVRDGRVFFCRWPPGITEQPAFERTFQMPVSDFVAAVEAERAREQGTPT